MQLFSSQFNLLEKQKKQALKDWIQGQLAELIINCQSSISTEASEQKPQHSWEGPWQPICFSMQASQTGTWNLHVINP